MSVLAQNLYLSSVSPFRFPALLLVKPKSDWIMLLSPLLSLVSCLKWLMHFCTSPSGIIPRLSSLKLLIFSPLMNAGLWGKSDVFHYSETKLLFLATKMNNIVSREKDDYFLLLLNLFTPVMRSWVKSNLSNMNYPSFQPLCCVL